mmetsp:Transcript_7429/g.25128  ORF Transcript_7429/g.25128 Transcript_7429/m.25128 type:complete len:229 (+) Transcript_7429:680-1366(+)
MTAGLEAERGVCLKQKCMQRTCEMKRDAKRVPRRAASRSRSMSPPDSASSRPVRLAWNFWNWSTSLAVDTSTSTMSGLRHRYATYAWRKPPSLKFGRHRGSHVWSARRSEGEDATKSVSSSRSGSVSTCSAARGCTRATSSARWSTRPYSAPLLPQCVFTAAATWERSSLSMGMQRAACSATSRLHTSELQERRMSVPASPRSERTSKPDLEAKSWCTLAESTKRICW